MCRALSLNGNLERSSQILLKSKILWNRESCCPRLSPTNPGNSPSPNSPNGHGRWGQLLSR